MNLTNKQITVLKFLTLIIPFLGGINIDLFVPSLPVIAKLFAAPNYLAQYTVTAYVLAYGVGQLFGGMLSDLWGRRKILVVSLGVYTLISLLITITNNIYLLVSLRFIQGLCMAGSVVTLRAISVDSFKGMSFAKIANNITMSWAIGPIVGPFIGGYLQHIFNWHADFYFFTIYGFMVFICAALYTPETLEHSLKMQPKQVMQVVKQTFTHQIFMLASITGMLLYAITILFNTIAPFYLQNVLHFSPVSYGHFALLMGLCCFIGNMINRVLIDKINVRTIIFSAFTGAILVGFIMLLFGKVANNNVYYFIIPSALLFLFVGIIFPNIYAIFIGIFKTGAGTANAVAGIIASGGAAAISGIATLIKISSAMPIGLIYFAIILVSLFLYKLILRQNVVHSLKNATKNCPYFVSH